MIESFAAPRHTLKAPISCVGTGLHSGARVAMRLLPGVAGQGIVFRRTDLQGGEAVEIPARHDLVADTRLCTVLAHPENPAWRVGTVEHLMAAAAALGVDDMVVEIDGAEVPILDGSAQSFVFLLDCAGLAPVAGPRMALEILRPLRVEDGPGFVELRPAPVGLALSVSIDFAAAAIGKQAAAHALGRDDFRREIAPARTFALLEEVEAMRRAGLALGGSLENAIVVDGARILNPCGLRLEEEFARHKLLDAIGDLALAGRPIQGRYVAHRPGHGLNNRLLRALFAAPDAWREVPAAPIAVATLTAPANVAAA